jgi:hypothetical protein
MLNPFDRLAARMDAATVKRMGKTATINGLEYDVVPAELLEDMGPLSGTGTSLVVFSGSYQPRRNDSVDYGGESFSVTRFDRFNGKPRIHLE